MNNDEHKSPAQDVITKPLVLIVMGVSGSGKTVLSHELGKALNIQALDADDFHSDENKSHMASGRALSDTMRQPWVNSLRAFLQGEVNQGKSTVLAFSGLRHHHRNLLRIDNSSVMFFFLHGPKKLIAKRLCTRQNHFMPDTLLDSQFESLEYPENEDDVVPLDISGSMESILKQALNELSARGYRI